jgi:hypothetical protein
MWRIQESFIDVLHPIGKGSFCLNPDKIITSYHIEYPITWAGFINGIDVKIIQTGASAKYRNDFEIIQFPDNYYVILSQIINSIDNYLKIID